jgi:hypothetical protein
MVNIRRARMEDLLAMQQCNLMCLPENYQARAHTHTHSLACNAQTHRIRPALSRLPALTPAPIRPTHTPTTARR